MSKHNQGVDYENFNGGLSRKVLVGDLGVPFREIPLSTGETQRIYNTSLA